MSLQPKIPCSVEILTLNAAQSLERCLESVSAFDDIMVLDGNSTDATTQIAQRFGARIFPQSDTAEKNVRITNFAEARNKGLVQAKHHWFFFIDRDEYLSPEAVEEIRGIVTAAERPFCAYRLPRLYVVNDEVIGRSSVYPNYQTRLFYLPDTLGFAKPVHEVMRLREGTTVGTLQSPEYVPIDPPAVLRAKWEKYLNMQTAQFVDLSFARLLKSISGNLRKFFVYTFRYLLTFIQGSGKRMPFWFEYQNALYHLRLMWRMIKNYTRKSFRS